jgi:hypothetical protein
VLIVEVFAQLARDPFLDFGIVVEDLISQVPNSKRALILFQLKSNSRKVSNSVLQALQVIGKVSD